MYGRAAIQKSTGKLIEFQSGKAPLGTLTQNAINGGIPEDDIEEKYVSAEEFHILLEMTKMPEDKEKEREEKLIRDEIRQIAIERLKSKGILK